MNPLLHRALALFLPPLVLFALVVIAWNGAVVYWELPPYLVPTPVAVLNVAKENRAALWSGALLTGKAALLGLLASLVVGILIAFVFSQSRLIQRAGYPYAIFLQTVPIVAIAPLIILWFGHGFQSIVIISFIVSLFPIITNTTTGLTTLDPNMVELFEVNNATRLQRLLKLQLPGAVPYIVAGARISSGLSVIGVIVGEFFAGFGGNKFGLGYLIYFANATLKTSYLFAAVISSTLLGLAMFALITGIGNLLTLRWRGTR
ncbi:ABC transporter permease subunit [bacterium]|nr:ABC transporter permease subunit [bacterium]